MSGPLFYIYNKAILYEVTTRLGWEYREVLRVLANRNRLTLYYVAPSENAVDKCARQGSSTRYIWYQLRGYQKHRQGIRSENGS